MSKRTRSTQKRKRGWKQWKEKDAREALASWRESGLPLSTYARSRGIGAERLRWWRGRLKGQQAASGAGAEAAALRLVPAVVKAPLVSLRRTTVSVRWPGGAVLEISDVQAVPPEWLSAVVGAAAGVSR